MKLSFWGLCILLFLAVGCSVASSSSTQYIPSVQNFDAPRYMGHWYEQVWLENYFEEGLQYVTADYSMNPDGTVRILNAGVKADGTRQEAVGRGGLRDLSQGELGVTFSWFQFFPAPYRIIELDSEYRTAVITTNSKSYLWILSRDPVMNPKARDAILERMKGLGFDLTSLVYVRQDSFRQPD